jgi:hypothetical protein
MPSRPKFLHHWLMKTRGSGAFPRNARSSGAWHTKLSAKTTVGRLGLQFKKLEGEDHIYSARIGLDYRALAVMKKDRIVWYWIGNHADYDRLV